MKYPWLALIALSFALPSLASESTECTDASGKVHYTFQKRAISGTHDSTTLEVIEKLFIDNVEVRGKIEKYDKESISVSAGYQRNTTHKISLALISADRESKFLGYMVCETHFGPDPQ